MDPQAAVLMGWGMSAVLVLNLVLSTLVIVRKPAVRPPEGATVLRLGSAHLALPVLAAVIPIGCLVILVAVPAEKQSGGTVGMTALGLLMCTVLTLIAVYGFREALYAFGAVTEEGIEKYSAWWGSRRLAWEDVRRVIIYPVGAVKIRGQDGTRIGFSAYWTGRGKLGQAISQYVDPERVDVRAM
jgi:hypothetical protein